MTATQSGASQKAITIFTPPHASRRILSHGKQLSEVEVNYLQTIYDLHYTTIPQVALIHHQHVTHSTFNYVASTLKSLDDEHKNYVQRGYLCRAMRFSLSNK